MISFSRLNHGFSQGWGAINVFLSNIYIYICIWYGILCFSCPFIFFEFWLSWKTHDVLQTLYRDDVAIVMLWHVCLHYYKTSLCNNHDVSRSRTLSSYMGVSLNGGTQQPWVFPTKNDYFGVFWGYHHLRNHPYISQRNKHQHGNHDCQKAIPTYSHTPKGSTPFPRVFWGQFFGCRKFVKNRRWKHRSFVASVLEVWKLRAKVPWSARVVDSAVENQMLPPYICP